MKIALIALAALAAATGCQQKETVSSSNIRTKGIAATVMVTAGGAASEVEAKLRVGGDESNTYIILENGDKLVTEVGGEKKDMHAESEGVYTVNFATNAADTEFNFLRRLIDGGQREVHLRRGLRHPRRLRQLHHREGQARVHRRLEPRALRSRDRDVAQAIGIR